MEKINENVIEVFIKRGTIDLDIENISELACDFVNPANLTKWKLVTLDGRILIVPIDTVIKILQAAKSKKYQEAAELK